MNEGIRRMLDVQVLDQEINKLDKDHKLLKDEVDKLEAEYARRKKILAAMATQATELAKRRAALELDEKTAEEAIKQTTRRMEMVKNARELEALNHQMETARATLSNLDEQLLTLMDEEEQLQKRDHDGRESTTRFIHKAKAEKARLEKLMADNRQLAEGIKVDRARAEARVDEKNREVYDWLRQKQKLLPVRPLQGEACGGCGSLLPPGVVAQIVVNEEPMQCPQCNNFLYSEK